jgi:hypothetical protein
MVDLSSLPWPDVCAVGIRTTADGPFAEDVFWQFVLAERCFEIPGQCVDGSAFDELCARLPGVDHEKIVRAMGSANERIFRIWHREDSRFRPGRDELAARFRALVGRLGGAPEAAPPVFDGQLSQRARSIPRGAARPAAHLSHRALPRPLRTARPRTDRGPAREPAVPRIGRCSRLRSVLSLISRW